MGKLLLFLLAVAILVGIVATIVAVVLSKCLTDRKNCDIFNMECKSQCLQNQDCRDNCDLAQSDCVRNNDCAKSQRNRMAIAAGVSFAIALGISLYIAFVE